MKSANAECSSGPLHNSCNREASPAGCFLLVLQAYDNDLYWSAHCSNDLNGFRLLHSQDFLSITCFVAGFICAPVKMKLELQSLIASTLIETWICSPCSKNLSVIGDFGDGDKLAVRILKITMKGQISSLLNQSYPIQIEMHPLCIKISRFWTGRKTRQHDVACRAGLPSMGPIVQMGHAPVGVKGTPLILHLPLGAVGFIWWDTDLGVLISRCKRQLPTEI
jgi:hypothetical protein